MNTQIIVEKILKGGTPSITGSFFTESEFKEIKQAVEKQKDNLDKYLDFVVKPRVI